MLIEVKVNGLIIDPNSSSPIILLKGVNSDLILPIWIGSYEANAIALEIEKIISERPMTHDLIRNLVAQFELTVEKIVINDLSNNTYFAQIELINKDRETIFIDSRPSDAIALALRIDCPIYITKRVYDISVFTSVNSNRPTIMQINPSSQDDWPDVIG